jgi:hypothetical protein
MDTSSFGQVHMTDCCQLGNEHSGTKEYEKRPDWLSNHQLLKENSAV